MHGDLNNDGFIETLNRRFRTEGPNADWFVSVDDARAKCEASHRDGNEIGPHGGIGVTLPARRMKSVNSAKRTLTESRWKTKTEAIQRSGAAR